MRKYAGSGDMARAIRDDADEGGTFHVDLLNFQAAFLNRLFDAGILRDYPGADFYCVGYGDICAYKDDRDQNDVYSHNTLLATWSQGGPDSEYDLPGGLAALDPAEWAGDWITQ